MKIFKEFESTYEDVIQLDGAFSIAHINYGKSPKFHDKDGKKIAEESRKENVSSEERIENVTEQIFCFKGTANGTNYNDRVSIWKNYWIEYINAFDKMSEILPESVVTVFIGRQAIEIGFKYLILKNNCELKTGHDLGDLAELFFSSNSTQEEYMEDVKPFCRLYFEYIEETHPEYFRYPDYKDNTFFAGNQLDIKWLTYNMVLILLKLIHYDAIEKEFY